MAATDGSGRVVLDYRGEPRFDAAGRLLVPLLLGIGAGWVLSDVPTWTCALLAVACVVGAALLAFSERTVVRVDVRRRSLALEHVSFWTRSAPRYLRLEDVAAVVELASKRRRSAPRRVGFRLRSGVLVALAEMPDDAYHHAAKARLTELVESSSARAPAA
jgi:hypothetical protein